MGFFVGESARQLSSGLLTTPQEHYALLHGGQRKSVVLWKRGRKETDGREWYSLEPHEAQAALKDAHGQADLFITPNEFYRWRKTKLLAAINALWVDIDLRDTDTTPVQAAEDALEKLRKAKIPDPSLIVYTGRGCHLYFIVNRTPPHALPRWQAAQKALVSLLAGDPNASGCTRVLRLVGSRNSKASAEAQTVTGQVLNGRPYDFDFLLDQILIPRGELRDIRAARAARSASSRGDGKAPPNVGTIYKVWYYRFQDILKIVRANWSDQVPEGHRDTILFHAAVALSWFTHAHVLVAEIKSLARRITPSLTDTEVEGIANTVVNKALASEEGRNDNYFGKSIDPRYRYKSQTLYDALAHLIEPHFGLLDELKSIIPDAERRRRRAERDKGRDRVAEGRYQHNRYELVMRRKTMGAELGDLRAAGRTWDEIGAQYGISAGAAKQRHARWLKGSGQPVHVGRSTPVRDTQALDKQIADHLAANRSIREIAQILGVPKSTVGRRAIALSHQPQVPPSCMVARAMDLCGLLDDVFIENDQPIGGGLGGESVPVDNSAKTTPNTPDIAVRDKPKSQPGEDGPSSPSFLIDPDQLNQLRNLSFSEVIRRLKWSAKEDYSYRPREAASRAGSRRFHLSQPDSPAVHEVLVTWPLWIDMRTNKGGRGSISFVMHFGSIKFTDAVNAIKQNP